MPKCDVILCEIFQVIITNRKSKHVFNSECNYHNYFNNIVTVSVPYLCTQINHEQDNKIKQVYIYIYIYKHVSIIYRTITILLVQSRPPLCRKKENHT
jgi:hypothetical protein